MPIGGPLGQGDIQRQQAREVGYYGGVRQGFEQARTGLEAVIEHLSGLLQQNPDNVRLERYLTQLNKVLAKIHKLQMRSSRVRDRSVDRKQPKQPGGNYMRPFGSPGHGKSDTVKQFNSGKMPDPEHTNEWGDED